MFMHPVTTELINIPQYLFVNFQEQKSFSHTGSPLNLMEKNHFKAPKLQKLLLPKCFGIKTGS